jgi:NADH-quinone oxidoreductase subunit L
MRQITLTFLGKPRSKSAEHAHESRWTMTVPLIVLAFFGITAGWVNIPETFPILGRLVPNFFHDFIAETLAEHPEAVAFNFVPFLTSVVVSLGGLYLGWVVYRRVKVGESDPIEKPLGPVYTVLKNKYYFDELYDFLFVRPAKWLAETFTYNWMDQKVIDGILHSLGRIATVVGRLFREWIDKPIVNGFGDFVGEGTKRIGRSLKFIQTGRVQQYMVMALVIAFGALFFYLFRFFLP